MRMVKIPNRIDDPIHILLWEADELMPIIIMLTLGVILSHVTLFLIISAMITKYYRKFKNNHSDGYLLHKMYWMGLIWLPSSVFPNPFIRRYIP